MDGVAQTFQTEETLREYTKRTASYFPYNSPKAGKLLRLLLQKLRQSRFNKISRPPLSRPLSPRDGVTKDVAPSTSRGIKRHTLVSESIEVAYASAYAEFANE